MLKLSVLKWHLNQKLKETHGSFLENLPEKSFQSTMRANQSNPLFREYIQKNRKNMDLAAQDHDLSDDEEIEKDITITLPEETEKRLWDLKHPAR